jgi:hypothetical protein
MDPQVRFSQHQRLPVLAEGCFGRLFPGLPCLPSTSEALLRYGAAGGALECLNDGHRSYTDNPRIAAGWPFFGQLIAHDITHDRAPLQEKEDLGSLQNFRSPRLDLECIYGAGPVGQPYLYQLEDTDKFLLGSSDSPVGDLPRNQQNVALIGDPRNDTHLFISQLHLAFLHFHNRVVDCLRADSPKREAVFERAQRLVRWHYQWIVLHEFLPLSVGEDRVRELLENEVESCAFEGRPFVPIEFSAAAYRFGHAQIRADYDVNARMLAVPLFPDLVGIRPVTSERQVEWARLFQFPQSAPPLPSRRIGPQLVGPLMRLPTELVGQPEHSEFRSLATRDLYRGHAVELPSGQAIARAMGVEPSAQAELRLMNLGWRGETPLWLYILAEAEAQQQGERLGEVGGRIVAEVLIRLLKHDQSAYLSSEPDWKPPFANKSGQFGIGEMLQIAGVA